MPFKTDEQRRAAFANMGKTNVLRETMYPDASISTTGAMILKNDALPVHTHDTMRVKLCKTRDKPDVFIKSPSDIHAYMIKMEDYDREYGKLIHLNTKNGIVGVETVGIGSINANIVHPRELMKGAILNNSASVIFVHNHPSGNAKPSKEDIAVSKKLNKAFKEIGIDFLDSLVIGRDEFTSLKDEGVLHDAI